jgi:hypothetical protein
MSLLYPELEKSPPNGQTLCGGEFLYDMYIVAEQTIDWFFVVTGAASIIQGRVRVQ